MVSVEKLVLVLLLLSAPAYAVGTGGGASHTRPRTLSIDTAYLPFLQSNRAMNQLWIEYEGLGSAIFDTVSNKTFVGSNGFTRVPWLILSWIGWDYLDYGFFVGN